MNAQKETEAEVIAVKRVGTPKEKVEIVVKAKKEKTVNENIFEMNAKKAVNENKALMISVAVEVVTEKEIVAEVRSVKKGGESVVRVAIVKSTKKIEISASAEKKNLEIEAAREKNAKEIVAVAPIVNSREKLENEV